MPTAAPPRLLLIGNFLSASLGNRFVSEDLADRLEAHGWAVQVTSTKRARLPRLLDFIAIPWRLRATYDVANVEVYSGLSFVWAEAASAVLRAAGKPYVLTLHGGNLPTFARRWPRRVAMLLKSAAAVAAPSGFLREQLRPFRDDVQLIPNAIELAEFEFRERSRPAPRLVWLRAFHSIYNPTLAPAVLARVAAAHPDARLAMIGADKGDGSFQATRAAADRLGVGGSVEFPGAVSKDEVPARLQEGDIFINTTNVDNTPVSVLEAMACGLCVVSTSVGGIPYMLRDGVDSLLVPPDDAEAMAAAVSRLLADPALAARISRAGRSMVEELDWKPVLARWEELFTAVAAG
jgi:glycosyltransferase involved in cell wall biosynthesis